MANNKLVDQLSRTFEVEMPQADNLEDYLDNVIRVVRPWGEDLRENKFYENRPWLEMRDSDNFHDTILHFFNKNGEYLRVVNGNVSSGSWRYMASSNKLLIEQGGKAELYDLAFLNTQFFILMKHGDQQRLGRRKYFMMVNERFGSRLEWRDALELLFNTYRSNNNSYITLALIILAVIAIVLILSV